MQAILVTSHGGPSVLQVADVPRPTPTSHELLVRVEAAGLNFSDIQLRTGDYPSEVPFIAGSEGAGTIEAVGNEVHGFCTGDRIAWAGVPGAHAEYCAVPASQAIRVPVDLGADIAAAVLMQGMTAHYLSSDAYRVAQGDICLVHAAAGGVGMLLVQMCTRAGATVVATVSSKGKAPPVREVGAAHVTIAREHGFSSDVLRFTSGEKFHVVFDSVGQRTFLEGLDVLRPRGSMVLFGQASGPVPEFDVNLLRWKGSLHLTRPSLVDYVATRKDLLTRANSVFDQVRNGQLTVHVAETYPLTETAAAHKALERRNTVGKLLIIP